MIIVEAQAPVILVPPGVTAVTGMESLDPVCPYGMASVSRKGETGKKVDATSGDWTINQVVDCALSDGDLPPDASLAVRVLSPSDVCTVKDGKLIFKQNTLCRLVVEAEPWPKSPTDPPLPTPGAAAKSSPSPVPKKSDTPAAKPVTAVAAAVGHPPSESTVDTATKENPTPFESLLYSAGILLCLGVPASLLIGALYKSLDGSPTDPVVHEVPQKRSHNDSPPDSIPQYSPPAPSSAQLTSEKIINTTDQLEAVLASNRCPVRLAITDNINNGEVIQWRGKLAETDPRERIVTPDVQEKIVIATGRSTASIKIDKDGEITIRSHK